MKKSSCISLWVFIFIFNLNLYTQNEDIIRVDTLIKEVISKNPEILAAKKEYEFYKNKISQSYYPSDPQIGFENMYSGDENNFIIRQNLEFPTKLYTKKKISENESQIYWWKYLSVKNEVIYKLYETYINYYFTFVYEKIYKENLDLMKSFSKIIEIKNSVNQAKQSDVLKTHIELLKIDNEITILNQEREIYKAKLNFLLNRDLNLNLGIPAELEFREENLSYEDLKNKIEKNNPDLNISLLKILIAEKNIILSKQQQNLPDIMFLYRKRYSNNISMDNTYDFSIAFSLPLWFKKQKDNIIASKIGKEMFLDKYQSDKNKILFSLKEAFIKIQTYKKFIDLYKTTFIPHAESIVMLSIREFESNNGSFIDVLEAYRSLIDIKKEYYLYLMNYFILNAEIKRIMGEENE